MDKYVDVLNIIIEASYYDLNGIKLQNESLKVNNFTFNSAIKYIDKKNRNWYTSKVERVYL